MESCSIAVSIGWTGPGAIPWDSWIDAPEGADPERIETLCRAKEAELDAAYPDKAPHRVRPA